LLKKNLTCWGKMAIKFVFSGSKYKG